VVTVLGRAHRSALKSVCLKFCEENALRTFTLLDAKEILLVTATAFNFYKGVIAATAWIDR